MSGAPGNAAIQNRDDAATVPVVQNGAGEDIRDYSDPGTPDVSVGLISGADVVDPFSGSALELFTGEIASKIIWDSAFIMVLPLLVTNFVRKRVNFFD